MPSPSSTPSLLHAATRLLALFALGTAVLTLGVASAAAQRDARRSFDAVGGGSQSAMSFGSNGVAWRMFPPGSRPGYEASSTFQSFGESELLRRFEGMEGKIHTQTFYKLQERSDQTRKQHLHAEESQNAAERPGKRARTAQAQPTKARATKAQATKAQATKALPAAPTTRELRWGKVGEAARGGAAGDASRSGSEQPVRVAVYSRRERRMRAAAESAQNVCQRKDRAWWAGHQRCSAE